MTVKELNHALYRKARLIRRAGHAIRATYAGDLSCLNTVAFSAFLICDENTDGDA